MDAFGPESALSLVASVGADGSVFVADLDNKCVHVFDSAFRYIRKLTRPLEVQVGQGAAQ
jgi:hypothetical protein